MKEQHILEVPIQGMDCAGCAQSVRYALEELPGVRSADVLLSAEKARVDLSPDHPATRDEIRRAVEAVGYRVPDDAPPASEPAVGSSHRRRVLALFVVVFGIVLAIAVGGRWLGAFDLVQTYVPWPVGVALVLLFGFPVFKGVVRAAWRRQVTAHTLMTVGVLAALVAGEWVTAAVIVLFMRIGEYIEQFTTERARQSVRSVVSRAPQTARVEREGEEHEVPIDDVQPGEVVVVRPGEKIPVDGEVVDGQATVDQAAITGEGLPVDVGPGSRVYAATIAQLGSLRVQTAEVGADTTFGRVVRMVEEAEAHRGQVQRLADRFSGYYLPVVVGIAAVTFLVSQDVMATVAVLVVACSCAFALATPVAVLATVGAGARQGLLIKGGKYLEALAKADVLLLDKTGTLTLGQPQITDVVSLDGLPEHDVLRLAASAEHYSEHPLAEAVRRAAEQRGLIADAPEQFEAIPGRGVRARIDGHEVVVGNQRLAAADVAHPAIQQLTADGKTLLFVEVDHRPVGILAAADSERAEVHRALQVVKDEGLRHIELLTGDTEQAASTLAERLELAYRAELLPEEKIAIVRAYQAQGHTVVMVGDGVNDAPALAQADVGIAMGAVGTDVAIDAAHVVLMREDWYLVPVLLRMARRTLRVVRGNIAFTALYNAAGLSLAALGVLPPILAAALHAVPDLGILANSSRLLRQQHAAVSSIRQSGRG